MEIGRIEGATRVIGKAQGYYGLPVRDEAKNLGDLPHMLETAMHSTVTGPNTPTIQTCWFPSPDEIDAISKGAPIYLNLVGVAHPPVMLSVGEVPRDVCPTCNGCGYQNPAEGITPCEVCNGSGGVPL